MYCLYIAREDMGSVWEAESHPSVQDYYLVLYFALAFPVARFLLDCFFYQVHDLGDIIVNTMFSETAVRLLP